MATPSGAGESTPGVGTGILADVTDDSERVIRYFEDYPQGLVVDCGTFTIGEAELIDFAKEYDPQPFHVDPVGAADGPFGGLIASGWHTISLTMRQLVEHWVSPESSLGAAGIDEIRWPNPVRPGDTLHVQGMNRKQRSHHRTSAKGSSRPPQHPEQQHDVQRMEEHIHVVRPCGIGPE